MMNHKYQQTLYWLMFGSSLALFLLAASIANSQELDNDYLLPPPVGAIVKADYPVVQKKAVVRIPVLKTGMRKGDVITQEHLDYKELPPARVSNTVITDANNLIGKELTRAIAAYMPIYGHSITEPPLVKKNKQVTVVFNKAGIQLRGFGRAMESGLHGERIKVLNENSGNVIVGTVIAENIIRVQ